MMVFPPWLQGGNLTSLFKMLPATTFFLSKISSKQGVLFNTNIDLVRMIPIFLLSCQAFF